MRSVKNLNSTGSWQVAAWISLSYALVAGMWLYASDHLLASHAACPPALRFLQIYNGWLFVVATAVLLYGLIGSLVPRSQRPRPPAADLGSTGRTESAFASSSGWPGTCTPPEAVWRESQTLLQALIERTSDAIYIKDWHGRYQLLNQAVTQITGKSAAEVIGQDDTVLFPLDEARQVMAGDRRVLAGKTTVTYEETVTTASGEKRTYLSTKGVIVDLQGETRGLFGRLCCINFVNHNY